ncbi:MAG TPA: hypothetical protein VJ784_14260 [Pyrinomonadaceae bacterium]|jgi:hypothetical protein|nr:hypothetical protein [Pyrinomonadaceae bacterium]
MKRLTFLLILKRPMGKLALVGKMIFNLNRISFDFSVTACDAPQSAWSNRSRWSI